MAEQLLAVDVGHPRAQAGVSVAQLAVHSVQGVGHGVHGVHHELHLPLLLVAGVASHFLQTCQRRRQLEATRIQKVWDVKMSSDGK